MNTNDDKDLYDRINQIEIELSRLKTCIEKHEIYTEKSLEKTEKSLDLRLEGMNEFRDQLTEQARSFLTIDRYEATIKAIEGKIDILQKIAFGGLAVVSFLVFAIPLLLHYFEVNNRY